MIKPKIMLYIFEMQLWDALYSIMHLNAAKSHPHQHMVQHALTEGAVGTELWRYNRPN
jgi:hypothetical protein